MRMYASIQFDREINKDKHQISPGSYELEANGTTYRFDFNEFDGSIDNDDKTILHCRMKDEDLDSFPEMKEMKKHLADITKVNEIFIFTGENEIDEIHPIKLMYLSFADNENSVYVINSEILERAKVIDCYD